MKQHHEPRGPQFFTGPSRFCPLRAIWRSSPRPMLPASSSSVDEKSQQPSVKPCLASTTLSICSLGAGDKAYPPKDPMNSKKRAARTSSGARSRPSFPLSLTTLPTHFLCFVSGETDVNRESRLGTLRTKATVATANTLSTQASSFAYPSIAPEP